MEERELFYYQKALGLLKLGMTKEVLENELAYFIASNRTAAIKGYKRALFQNQKNTEIIKS